MFNSDEVGATQRSDPLTVTIASTLALVAGAGTVFCLVYAIWWLVTFWAPT